MSNSGLKSSGSSPQSIGIFGGTFDPVHNGHVMVARTALEELALDRLLIVPAAQSPFKPGETSAPAAARVELLRLALADLPGCELDLQEVEREGVSYSIDTVLAVAKRFPEAQLFYLIGADHAATLPQWREAAALAELATFVVVPRPGEAVPVVPEPFRGQILVGQPTDISARTLRAKLGAGEPIEDWVPPAVAEALKTMHLY